MNHFLPLPSILGLACAGWSERHPDLQRDLTLEHDGQTRTYHLHAAPASAPRPLIVVLHGGGATLDAFVGDGGGAAPMAGAWLDVARDEGLHVAIPQGLGEQWNDCRADCVHCGDADDAGFLLALIDEVSAKLDVDPDRVHVAGESNGGFMTQRMAVEHPERFGALGVVIAAAPADDACAPPEHPVSMIFVPGTSDAAVPYDGGVSPSAGSGSVRSSDETIAVWLARNACDPTPVSEALADLDPDDGSTVTRERWTCGAGHEVERLAVIGGPHIVPSIGEQTTAWWEALVGGQQNHDIETAREMWSFFAAHPRR